MVKPDKSRYVYLYLPSAADKARWESLAKEAGVPLSKFVIEVFEGALAEETQKKIVLEKYENELKRYRNQAFLENKFEGTRKYSKDLLAILKRGITVDSYKLLEELGIDPSDTEVVKAISNQLEDLERYGLVTSTQRGWRYQG
ncbi:MAG: hypothetical protein LUQ30_05185 [Methanothrix sp.]|nr:hypothetical protein [Methanothrix sp.]